MNKKEIYHKLLNFIQDLIFLKFRFKQRNLYEKLLLNRKFKDLHLGERCFILGNGPSLRNQDLSLLSDEYVFTVNQIMRHPDFEKIRTNYHFWADPMFFEIDENRQEDLELLEVMKNLNTQNNKPECFFPIDQSSFISKYKLDEFLQVNYYRSKYVFHDNYSRKIDYTKITPGFGTVVQWAITMAIYMGFKEIYMLGCDNTGIIVTINSVLKENTDMDYAYQVSENEKKRMENLLDKQTLEDYCISYTDTLAGYRRLYNYCLERKIKLVNCSAKSVIDTIPREKFENVISREKHNETI
jgi:hypothetical protein